MADFAKEFVHQAPFGIEVIQQIIPHRYPFLLVDYITGLGPDWVSGYKCLTANEGVFAGHFPERKVYPGVLMLESLAQVGAVWLLNQPHNTGKIAYLMTVDDAKFRRPAVPGERIDILATVTAMRSKAGKVDGVLKVGEEVVATAKIMFAF